MCWILQKINNGSNTVIIVLICSAPFKTKSGTLYKEQTKTISIWAPCPEVQPHTQSEKKEKKKKT